MMCGRRPPIKVQVLLLEGLLVIGGAELGQGAGAERRRFILKKNRFFQKNVFIVLLR